MTLALELTECTANEEYANYLVSTYGGLQIKQITARPLDELREVATGLGLDCYTYRTKTAIAIAISDECCCRTDYMRYSNIYGEFIQY